MEPAKDLKGLLKDCISLIPERTESEKSNLKPLSNNVNANLNLQG